MENNSSPEQHNANHEVLVDAVDRLAQQLGFIETEELRRIRELVIETSALGDKERVGVLVLEYQLQGEELLNQLQGREYTRGQVGLIIARATLSRDMGNLESFIYHVGDAKEYAIALQEADVVSALERAPSIEIVRILSLYGEEFGFNQATLDEIAAEPYDAAFEMAYSYITRAGLDADEVLAAFMAE